MTAVLMPITRPAAIDQRAAAVAGVQGRVGLDHVVDEMPGDAPQRSAQGADDAGRHRGLEPQRTADGDDQLADAQLRRIAERGVGQLAAVGLDDGQVGPRIVADHPAGQLGAVAEPHPHSALAADDVVVGEQEAVGREQHAGTAAGPPRFAAEVDDRRPQRVGHLDDGVGKGVERFGIVGRRRRHGRRIVRAADSPPLVIKCCQKRDMGNSSHESADIPC